MRRLGSRNPGTLIDEIRLIPEGGSLQVELVGAFAAIFSGSKTPRGETAAAQ
jgi:hypothetical protein